MVNQLRAEQTQLKQKPFYSWIVFHLLRGPILFTSSTKFVHGPDEKHFSRVVNFLKDVNALRRVQEYVANWLQNSGRIRAQRSCLRLQQKPAGRSCGHSISDTM